MTNYSEKQLVEPSLRIIANHKNGITTQQLIENLRLILKPNGEDTLILSNRADDKFSQKVRNLKSHKSLEKNNWVQFKGEKYFITDKGNKHIDNIPGHEQLNLERDEIIFNFIPLKYFYFDERLNNFFNNENCNYVYDLHLLTSYGKDVEILKKYRNLGSKSLSKINNFYQENFNLIKKIVPEIDKEQISSIFKNNKFKIEKFVIKNLEKNKINSKKEITFSRDLIEDFFTKNFKKNNTYKMIFFERIMKNRTLDSIGKELKVTRERIRQIEKTIKDKLVNNLSIKYCFLKIENLLKDIVFEKSKNFRKKLISKKLIDSEILFQDIYNLSNFFGLKSIKKFKKINKEYFAFESKFYENELLKIIKLKTRNDAKNNGIINIDILLKEIKSKNFQINKEDLLDLIDEDLILTSLNIDNKYLLTNVLKSQKKSTNVLVGVIHSIMSVTSQIDIFEMISSIRRFRRLNNYSPEANVLVKICKFLKYEISNNLIINKNYNENYDYLNGVRKTLVKMFLDNEKIMTYEEILENYKKYNINLNSINVFLYENLFTNPRKGIFVLIGTDVDDIILDRLERNRKKLLKEISDSTEWAYDNDLNIVFSCSKLSLQKGIIYIPQNFTDELREGEYVIKNSDNIGKLKVFSSQLWLDSQSKQYFENLKNKNFKLVFDVINKFILINEGY
jgi:hypothetical protein